MIFSERFAHFYIRYSLLLTTLGLCSFAGAQCINTFPNTTYFETSNGGWTTGGTASDWAWGTPAKTVIKTAGGGLKCWISGGLNKTSYNNGQASWVKSPCYNFTNLKYPTVGFKAYWETENNFDGTVFQYSTDNGVTWKNVGAASDPKNCLNLNWFNSSVKFLGNTLGTTDGWSGSSAAGTDGGGCLAGNGSNGWVQASHTMPYLAGKASVQFRFYFAAGTSCNGYNGFAFDDVTVGEALPNFAVFSYTCTGGSNVSFNNTTPLCPTYTWNFGDPGSGAANTSTLKNPTHSFSAAGQYTVTLTASGPDNAPSTTTRVVTILDLNTQIVTDLNCNGDKNGSVTVTASPAIAGLNYSWNTVPAQLSQTATNLAAGTYVVTVSGANVCTASDNATLTDPLLLVNSSVVTQPTCKNNDGKIVLTTTGGTAPYTYSWTPNTLSSNTAASLPGGNYSVVIKDKNGCTLNESFVLTSPSSVTASITSIKDATCSGFADGSATVTASGGTAPYTYAWSPAGGTAATATGLAKNNYTVTVTDANNCTATASTAISEPALLNALVAVTDNSCGNNNGKATATVTGGTAPYTYAWSPGGATTASITNLSTQDYNLVVTDKNGCKATSVATVKSVGSSLSIQVSHTDADCFGNATGSANITVSGGQAPFTYMWNNGGTTAAISGLKKGTYSVIVKDALGCFANGSVDIAEPAIAVSLTLTPTDALCDGGTGSIATLANGGTSPYTYNWSNGSTVSTLSAVPAGLYNLMITDKNGCKANASTTIKAPSALAVAVTTTQPTCGNNNGTAVALTTGGTAPYTYNWLPGNITTSSISGLGAATYSLTVTDKNGCKQGGSAVIAPSAAVSFTLSKTDINCFGDATGTALVTTTGGQAPFTFVWSNGATAASVTGLKKGNYSVTVKDALGCSASNNVSIAEPATALTVALTPTNALCSGGTGNITSMVTGGTVPYSYNWSNGATTNTLSTGTAGGYTLSITDKNGCKANATTSVAIPTPIIASLNVVQASCGLSNGSASALVTGGTTPYTYNWLPGNQNTAAISGLAPASYGLTITDKNGCQQTANAVIANSSAISFQISKTDVNCFGNATGAALVTTTAGQAPFTYTWSHGAGTAAVSGLKKGTYSVTVKDALNCTNTASVTIAEPAASLSIAITHTDAVCNGGTGAATAQVSGGTPAYAYTWSNGSTSSALSAVKAGSYTLSVTDKNGCTAVAGTVIAEPAALTVPLNIKQTTCGSFDGSITANPAGGVAPYTYAWSNGAFTNSSQTNLAPGQYIVTVTDKNGCQKRASADINFSSNVTLQVTKTDVACAGTSTGAASVTVTGGQAPYSYAWSNNATTSSITSVPKGVYSIAVKDAAGCSATTSVNIAEPAVPLAVQLTAVNALCAAGNGSIQASVTGGTVPYSYLWSDGSIDASIASAPAGSFTLTVTDKNGCKTTGSGAITAPTALVLSFTTRQATCGASDGSIATAVSGGVAPYTYLWQPGNQTTAGRSNLAAGNYTLLVTDKNGCTLSKDAVVTTPGNLALQTSKTDVSCNGDKTGTASVTISGGSPAFSIAWSNGATTPSVTGLVAGSYSVVVKDAAGCNANSTIVIGQPAALSATLTATSAICLSNSGAVNSNVTGGAAPYSYSWQPGNATSANLSAATAGTYTLSVADKNGCKSNATATVIATNPLKINLGKDTSICGTAGFTVTPGNFASYQWHNGTSSPVYNVSAPGKFWVTVRDQRGCVASDTINIVADCGEIWFPTGFTPNGDGKNDEFGPLGNLALISDFTMAVFDRWGMKVFESYNPLNKWNGKFQGKMMGGNFVWYARYKGRNGEVVQKGTLVLIR